MAKEKEPATVGGVRYDVVQVVKSKQRQPARPGEPEGTALVWAVVLEPAAGEPARGRVQVVLSRQPSVDVGDVVTLPM